MKEKKVFKDYFEGLIKFIYIFEIIRFRLPIKYFN